MTMEKRPNSKPKKSRAQARKELSIYQSFYGRHAGMQSTIFYTDIMNIMDCSKSTALELLDELRQYFGDSQVMVSEFCDYMEIDELLIQLFLLSLIKDNKINIPDMPFNEYVDDPENNVFINDEIWCVIGSMYYGHPTTDTILEARAQMWRDMHPPDPRGTRMYKRDDEYIVTMFAHDLMRVLPCSERTAYRLLQETRVKMNKHKRYYVTVEEWCFINEYPEHIMRKKLAEIYGNNGR